MNEDERSKLQEIHGSGESLATFLKGMKRFDRYFCDLMASGVDFTLKMEVRGNKGQVLHVKLDPLSFDRPPGVEREIEKRRQAEK